MCKVPYFIKDDKKHLLVLLVAWHWWQSIDYSKKIKISHQFLSLSSFSSSTHRDKTRDNTKDETPENQINDYYYCSCCPKFYCSIICLLFLLFRKFGRWSNCQNLQLNIEHEWKLFTIIYVRNEIQNFLLFFGEKRRN